MNIAGYLVNKLNAIEGESGIYNYVLASNGIWIRTGNQHLWAMVPVAKANIRGLTPLASQLIMGHGKIPQRLYDLALSVMLARPEKEVYVGILWNDGYQLYVPEQTGSGASVRYLTAENVVCEMHSHGFGGPGFSIIDDSDELGFKIYGVVGELGNAQPSVNFRVGVYGYFMPVTWGEVFEGELWDKDVVALQKQVEEIDDELDS